MQIITSGNECTGCAACMNACTKGAITMKPQGRFGHLFPVIDSDKCIDCGLCKKSCPVINKVELRRPKTAYAGWAKSEDENKKSTSGGAASVLTRKVLSEGGVVYGCANIGIDVKHIRIDKIEDIDLLRGSKYVQSSMGLIMKQVKQDLNNGVKVLFVGSPCQCAGLKIYLRKEYENLLLVDLICHGTPSLKLLQDHVSSTISKDQVVKHIYFRDGSNYEFSLIVKNAANEELYRSNLWKQRYHDAYYTSFIRGYTYRPSCNQCQFAKTERCSDITIGDFWGLGEKKPFVPIAKAYGYSVVLPNSEKGISMLNNISDLFYLQERDVEEAKVKNPQLNSPKRLSINARLFQWLFNHGCSLKSSLYIADWYRVIAFKLLKKINIWLKE